MLEMRPNCESCNCELPAESTEARICSYECTFCASCASNWLDGKCPNCGGELLPRPRRPLKEQQTLPTAAEQTAPPSVSDAIDPES